jgi:hypothetical protein
MGKRILNGLDAADASRYRNWYWADVSLAEIDVVVGEADNPGAAFAEGIL